MKSIFSLALAALTILTTSFARSAVISPTNSDTAFRFKLARPETDYVPFQLLYEGKVVKPNTPVHLDEGQECIELTISVTNAKNYLSKYCTTFAKGVITDIPIYGLKVKGRVPTADGVYGDILIEWSVGNRSGSLLSFASKLTNFEKYKLVPFFTDDAKKASISLFDWAETLNIDFATGIAEYTLPVETLAPITIRRLHARTFPDFQPAAFTIARQPTWTGAQTQIRPIEQRFAMPDQNSTTIQVLLMPWPQSDRMEITYTLGIHSTRVSSGHTGTGMRALPQEERVQATYPTELNFYRIDVDDVAVTSIDGVTRSARGTYSVHRYWTYDQPDETDSPSRIVANAPTRTGVDVIAGRYKVVVRYVDPFTLTDEQKIYVLIFK